MRGTVTRPARTGPSDRPAGFAGAAACLARRRPRRGPGAWRGGPSAGQDRRPLPGQALGREAPRQRKGCPHVPRAGRLRGTSRPSPLPRGLLCPRVRAAAAAGRGAWPSPDAARTAASGAVPQLPGTAAAASSPRVMTDDMLPPLGRRRGALGGQRRAEGGRGGPPQEEELAPGGQGRVQPLVPATVASVSLSCQDPSPGGGGSPAGRAACQLPGVGATRRGEGVGLWARPASRSRLQPHLVSGPLVLGVTLWAEGS